MQIKEPNKPENLSNQENLRKAKQSDVNLSHECLAHFVERSFQTVNPNTPFLHNWHIELLCKYLEACTRGEIRRLIINVPPRSLKSLCVTVAWPAWLLGNNPARRIIAASYSQKLSNKHSLDCKLVMQSEWYKVFFPKTRIRRGQNEKFKFVTTKNGFRFATSIGGTLTGEGGNFLIIDDPQNPTHMHSAEKRERTIDWFEQTFSSRLDNKKEGVIVLVMQRLHEDDLAGHLLKTGLWTHLNLPAIAREREEINFGGVKHVREIGQALHDTRESLKELEQMKLELGSQGFAAQYQQQPTRHEGGLIHIHWLKRFREPPANPTRIVQSWDTAIKSGGDNDYSVCTIWAEEERGYFLLDVFRKQLEYPDLKRHMLSLAEKWQPDAILIEDKASGQQLIQMLKVETKLPVIGINPINDKFTRMATVSIHFEAGRVFLPEHAAWLTDYEMELLNFSHSASAHDDQVDSTSQFLHWITKARGAKPGMRKL